MECGICQQEIDGKVRALNQHKQQAHPEIRDAMRQKRRAKSRRGVSMNYCQQCGKFVSLEAGEPEEQSIELTDESIVGAVRFVLSCAECSQEMHEATVEVAENSFEFEHKACCAQDDGIDLGSPDWGIEEEGGGRYSKHLYYAISSMTITCAGCKAETEIELTTEKIQASGFESLQ